MLLLARPMSDLLDLRGTIGLLAQVMGSCTAQSYIVPSKSNIYSSGRLIFNI